MSGLNYLQLKIPVDNANLVFEAIVSKYDNATFSSIPTAAILSFIAANA